MKRRTFLKLTTLAAVASLFRLSLPRQEGSRSGATGGRARLMGSAARGCSMPGVNAYSFGDFERGIENFHAFNGLGWV